MSNSYQPNRTHRRRRKRNAGRLGLAGALTGAVGIAAVAAAIVLVRPGGPGAEAGGSAPAGQGAGTARRPSVPSPNTGPALNLTTPEGYGYSLAAVEAGTDPRPLGAAQAPPAGTTYAYADYVLTNSQRRPVLLDYPADLFMPEARVPSSARERCMPQAGIPDGMCTLPNHSEITGRVDGAKPPVDENGTPLIPAGASYVVRIASDLPVEEGVSAEDLRLFVWNARYTSDLTGIELKFPEG